MQQHAEKLDLLGKLCPGDKKLEGMTFYLDGVKKRPTALLLEAICLLGGRVESFLHKDVSFVVTGSQEGQKEQKCTDINGGAKRMNEEAQRLIKQRETILKNDRQQPVTPRPMACGSRGKALLEKAISNNERLQGSSVLANARSWGVKILYVDDVLLYLKNTS
uniref:protein DBF4 homolog B-like n=1 Tax=Monopterus albus TaxID=43700 RepID=UPI0009B45633|nr:protein DBF4 homolog B-like [Monopterus albus]